MNIKKRSFKEKSDNLGISVIIILIIITFIKILAIIFPKFNGWLGGYGVNIFLIVVGVLFLHGIFSEAKSLLKSIKLKTSKKSISEKI